MRAGKLRHTISITTPTVTGQNSSGEDIVTDTPIGTFPCLIESLVGRELERAMQMWAQAKYKITMRRQPGVVFTRTMSATFGSRVLDILDVEDLGEDLRPEVIMYAQDFQG